MSLLSGTRVIRILIPALIIVVALAMAIMLLTRGGSGQPPPSLIVLARSTNITSRINQVSYQLSESYPAKAALGKISSELAEQGWKPMEEDFLNPSEPSSHARGWTYYVDGPANSEEAVQQWLGAWTNAKGDVVQYGLQYRWPYRQGPDADRYPYRQPPNDDLQVVATYFPAKDAEALRRRSASPAQQDDALRVR